MKKTVFLALFLTLLLCLFPSFVSADEGETYTLVTDTSQLTAGDEIILVSDDGAYFYTMGSGFGGVRATIGANSLEAPAGTVVLTLVDADGGWLLSSGSVYLSVSNNALTTVSEAENASLWSVKISDGTASITSNGAAICFDGTAFYYGSGGNHVAIYRSPRNDTYTITWLNHDGAILGTSDTQGGEMPVYIGETPTKPNDSDYSYQFVGWSPTLAVATADATYTAQYQAYEKCGDDLYWSFNYETGVLTITGSGSMYNYPIYGSYGLLVKKHPWKSLQASITSVILQEGVTSISSEAFSNCTNMTSVTIPDSVTSIEVGAFYGCTGLTSITIPDSVIHIGNNAFDNTGWWNQQDEGLVYLSNILLGHDGAIDQPIVSIKEGTRLIAGHALSACSAIVRLSIPNSVTIIDEGAFSDCTGLTSVTIPKSVTIIGDSAFSYCTGLTSINLENNSIGNSMFSGCTGLTSITIPESITSIGGGAFSNCTGLTSATIPDSVTSLGSGGTFSGCIGLTELTMPCNLFYGYILNSTNISRLRLTKGTGIMNSFGGWNNYDEQPLLAVSIDEGVTNIGQAVFAGMSFLSSISIPNSVQSIENQAFFNCTGLTSIILPEGVTNLGYSAFSGCTGLNSIIIPDNVTSMGGSAFYGCTGLSSIIISKDITEIGYASFCGCTGLTSVTIPDDVTSIGEAAFAGCTGLTSITFGNRVNTIGQRAFSGCSSLTTIIIPDSVTNIADYAFENCTGMTRITMPCSTNYGRAFNGCTSITSIHLTKGTDVWFTASYENTPWYINRFNTLSITLEQGITSIRAYAFGNCKGLASISIPDSVTYIGDSAFSGCTGLTSVTIPDNITSIGGGVFSDCTGLTQVTMPCSIEESLFYNCSSINNVHLTKGTGTWGVTGIGHENSSPWYYSRSNVLTVSLDEGITSIGDYAFDSCTGLKSISIPNSVTSIGCWAFSGCTGLTSVIIPDNVISIGAGGFSYCHGLTSVTLGSGITSISSHVFESCSGLTDVYYNNTRLKREKDSNRRIMEWK